MGKTVSRMTGRTALLALAVMPAMPVLLPVQRVEAKPAGRKSPHQRIVLKKDDNGKQISVRAGDQLHIELNSNVGNGYEWMVSKADKNKLRVLGYATLIPAPGAPKQKPKSGASALQTFDFRTIAKGNVTLELQYRRNWEKVSAPARKYIVNITIK